ncbi:YvrJ family protein, partial [Proteiniclasticum sp.]|uniref:YvrJ family protein n=1 Tax=Proteiniclasticum sp. TaxID=2053595 RepID=UPI0037C67803
CPCCSSKFHQKYSQEAFGLVSYFDHFCIVQLGVIDVDVLLEAAANVGFPMVVSIYLLTRIEGKMENLTISINKLTGALEKTT